MIDNNSILLKKKKKIIIRICIRISSLPYRYTIDTFEQDRSNEIEIYQQKKIISQHLIEKEFHKSPYKIFCYITL